MAEVRTDHRDECKLYFENDEDLANKRNIICYPLLTNDGQKRLPNHQGPYACWVLDPEEHHIRDVY